jgi:hypothetical protein
MAVKQFKIKNTENINETHKLNNARKSVFLVIKFVQNKLKSDPIPILS